MASGRGNQLTKQIGENLVVAELGRRGFIATAFAGNVPDIDILATSPFGKTFSVQVKAIPGVSWQFDVRKFLDIDLVKDTQTVKGKLRPANRRLLRIFVQIDPKGNDKYYIFRWGYLQDHFHATYKGGKRPRNPKSFHCAIWPKELEKFRDNWKIIRP